MSRLVAVLTRHFETFVPLCGPPYGPGARSVRGRVDEPAIPESRARSRRFVRRVSAGLLALCVCVPSIAAQSLDDPPGVRASGMAGAFVAVADDGNAPLWNPAGLGQSGLFNAVIGGSTIDLNQDAGRPILLERNAWSQNDFGISIALPMVAFTYARTQTAGARAVAIAEPGPDRQDPRTAAVAQRLETSQYGISVAQSIGDSVVVGSTLRVVHGSGGAEWLPATVDAGTSLERAEDLPSSGRTRFDADIGVLAYAGRARLGLSMRHLAEPTFVDAAGGLPAIRLERGVRAGVAFGTGRMWNQQPWTIALDADLTTSESVDGERRAASIGAERWFWGRRVGLRGGGQWQTVGDRRPLASAGVSVAVAAGLYLDAYAAAGSDLAGRGWGVAARVAY